MLRRVLDVEVVLGPLRCRNGDHWLGDLWLRQRQEWWRITACTRQQTQELVEYQQRWPVGFPTPRPYEGLWVYRDRWYCDVDRLTREEVKAILDAREARRRAYIDNALSLVACGGHRPVVRDSIPADVRQLVFERDGGRCTLCGATTNLEYGHVIARALGGSSTSPGNIRLECGGCNRRRGVALGDG